MLILTFAAEMKLEEAIQQKNFENEFQKAHINLAYTMSWMNLKTNETLRPLGITVQQFNVLRILKGMSPKPASVKMITERMIDRTSNASRLVDKLKAKDLVERITCTEDRRMVHISITSTGLNLLKKASAAMALHSQEMFKSLSLKQAKSLNALLDDLRA